MSELEHQTLARLDALARTLPPRLAAGFGALRSRVGVGPGYFTHPLALPVLELPGWLGAPAAQQPALAFAGATGYLAVRLQDDHIDDDIGDSGEVTLLSALLLHHHDAALASLSPGPAFWARAARTWAAYGEAMLLERDLHRTDAAYTDAAFSQVLDRSRPLSLPAAAWLCASGQDARLPALDALIDRLVRAHQLQTDLIDLEKDHRAGRRTWLRAQLGAPESLPRALLLDGGLDRLVGIVQESLAALEQSARRAQLPPLVALAQARQARLAQTHRSVVAAFFTALLG